MFLLDTSLIALCLAIIVTLIIVFGGSLILFIGLNFFAGFQLRKKKPHIFLMDEDNPWRKRTIKEYLKEEVETKPLYRLVLPQVLVMMRLYLEVKSEFFPSRLQKEMSKEARELFELVKKETKETKKEKI